MLLYYIGIQMQAMPKTKLSQSWKEPYESLVATNNNGKIDKLDRIDNIDKIESYERNDRNEGNDKINKHDRSNRYADDDDRHEWNGSTSSASLANVSHVFISVYL